MKISGKKIEGKNTQHIIIPRADGDIVLIAEGISSFKEFQEVCQPPVPPIREYPDGRKEAVRSDSNFLKATNEWAKRKSQWMVIKSLEATPGLEWDTVDIVDPTTWDNFESELASAGFTEFDIARIIEGVMTANGVNQAMLEEAEKRFLHGREPARSGGNSQNTEKQNTPSGEVAKD